MYVSYNNTNYYGVIINNQQFMQRAYPTSNEAGSALRDAIYARVCDSITSNFNYYAYYQMSNEQIYAAGRSTGIGHCIIVDHNTWYDVRSAGIPITTTIYGVSQAGLALKNLVLNQFCTPLNTRIFNACTASSD